MKYLIVFILLLLAATFSLIGQTQSGSSSHDSKMANRVISNTGWIQPRIERMTLVRSASFESEGKTIALRVYQARNTNYDLINYFVGENDIVTINSNRLAVREMATYESRGKIFAYSLRLNPLSHASDEIRSYAGASIERLFLDQDGDGKFETMFQNSSDPAQLREWIREQP